MRRGGGQRRRQGKAGDWPKWVLAGPFHARWRWSRGSNRPHYVARLAVSNETLPAREIARRDGHRVWAEIDLDAIESNVRGLVGLAGDAKLLAVVKGNAYGHGAIAVAKAAMRSGAWG